MTQQPDGPAQQPDRPVQQADFEELADHVDEIRVKLLGLEQRVDTVGRSVGDLFDEVAGLGGDDTDDQEQTDNPDEDQGDEEKDEVPVFILYHDSGSPAEQAELAQLAHWVHTILVPNYVTEISPAQPWCAQWWEHPQAVARLHALWMAWLELSVPEAGFTGPSVWHRDHLDDAFSRLRSQEGPFLRCMIGSDSEEHFASRPVTIAVFDPVT